MSARSPQVLHAALIDLLLTAQPFRHGHGMARQRTALDQAMTAAGRALRVADMENTGMEDVHMDTRQPMEGNLQRLAREADTEARDSVGFRRDIHG